MRIFPDMRTVLLAVFLLVCSVNSKPSKHNNDDYDLEVAEPEKGFQNDYDYDGEEEVGAPEIPEPVFRTRPLAISAHQNETVELPCDIENGDSLVVLWRKNNDLIFQDGIRFNVGNNFRVDNRTLVISHLGANETANYTCSIPLTKTEHMDVTHQLLVQTPPQIVSLRAQHDIVQLDAGKTLVLTCKAMGFPEPTIKWSRKGERMESEKRGGEETLTIENISHHDAGDYQCLADNHIEPPAHQFIKITVAHAPVVRIEKLTVNTEEKLDVELICYVHGVPKPDVIWQMDGLNILLDERRKVIHHNHTHTLQIKRVERADFGTYTCFAANRVGRATKNITLTMNPSPAEHINTQHDKNRGVLTWKLESKAPISKYQLEYKAKSDSDWKTATPEITNPDGNVYTVSYIFENLPHGHYQAKLRSKNTYGWSAWSEITKFKSVEHQVRPGQHHRPDSLVPEQSTLREELNYDSEIDSPSGNEVIIPPELSAVQTAQPPLIETPIEHTQNREHEPHTQERQHPKEELKYQTLPHITESSVQTIQPVVEVPKEIGMSPTVAVVDIPKEALPTVQPVVDNPQESQPNTPQPQQQTGQEGKSTSTDGSMATLPTLWVLLLAASWALFSH